jgi:nuclear pore complex protein Nup93
MTVSCLTLTQIIESTNLIPMDGDVAKITRRAEEFKDLHESLQRNLPTYLTLAMDSLLGVHQNVKATTLADASRQMVIIFNYTEYAHC